MIKIKIIIIKNPKHTKLWSCRISRGIEKNLHVLFVLHMFYCKIVRSLFRLQAEVSFLLLGRF